MPPRKYGAEDARAHLPELLDRAHRGMSTLITKHGKPYALLVPATAAAPRRTSLLALAGTGKGLWGQSPARTVAALRDEWE